MTEPSGRATVEAFMQAIESKDFDGQMALLADDYVDEMPQSGERVRGRANWRSIIDHYPGGVGTVTGEHRILGADDRFVMTPTFSILRIEGSGDTFTYAGTIRYASGELWHIVAIVQVRNGKVAKTTTYYAAPFPAPEWRAPYVERIEVPHG